MEAVREFNKKASSGCWYSCRYTIIVYYSHHGREVSQDLLVNFYVKRGCRCLTRPRCLAEYSRKKKIFLVSVSLVRHVKAEELKLAEPHV